MSNPISLTSFGDNSKSIYEYAKKLINGNEATIRAHVANVFGGSAHDVSIELVDGSLGQTCFFRFEQLGKGSVEVGMEAEDIDSIYFKALRQEKTKPCPRVTESHLRVLRKIIKPFVHCFVSNSEDCLLPENAEFDEEFSFLIMLDISGDSFTIQVKLDSAYSEYLREAFGEAVAFGKDELVQFLDLIPVTMSKTLSERTMSLSEVSQLKANSTIHFPLKDSITFSIDNNPVLEKKINL